MKTATTTTPWLHGFGRLAGPLAALLSAAALLSGAARTPEGVPVLALDDSYIHLQYGWQAAQGQFLQYNPGDRPTSGATSLLHMLALAAGFRLGIGRDLMPAALVLAGILLFVLAAALVVDTARRLAAAIRLRDREQIGLLAGLLFGGSGWMAWAFLSGMETGLLVFAVAGVLWATLRRRWPLSALFSLLAVLTRPEAALLAAAAFVVAWWMPDRAGRPDLHSPGTPVRERDVRAGRPARRRQLVWSAVPLAAIVVPPLLNLLLTGSPASSGLASKSWFTIVPFSAEAVVRAMAGALEVLSVRLMGWAAPDGRWYVFPLLQVWAVVGCLALWTQRAARRAALIGLAWVVLGILATATLQTATWHHYRYQIPLYPALLVLGLSGLGLIARWIYVPILWLLVPALVWGTISTVDWAGVYALDTHTVLGQQMAIASWLRTHTPADARIAVHDIGVMRYVGQRYTIDVVGLTTAGMSAVYRNGPGSIYEALEANPPDYYAVYPDAAPPYFGLSSAPDLLGPVRFTARLDSHSPFTSAGPVQVVTEPEGPGAFSAAHPQQPSVLAQVDGLMLVDTLDTADLSDETAHGYRWWNAGVPPGFPTDARRLSYRQSPGVSLADGGRQLSGGDSFTLATLPGQPLRLVARLHQTGDMVLRVRVNGSEAGEWRLPAVPGEWLESVFLVPATLIDSSSTQFEIAVLEAPPDQPYGPYHYWAYQGEPAAPAPVPSTPLEVDFGNIVRLTGYDLAQTAVAPGDSLEVRLHWQALSPARADHRVFVHLVDPGNDTASGIVAQRDSAPYSGTYPFWVWGPAESVGETVALPIPDTASPGAYTLLVGIYDAATGERLPVSGASDFGAGRYELGTITIR